jgi:hypothetical protein
VAMHIAMDSGVAGHSKLRVQASPHPCKNTVKTVLVIPIFIKERNRYNNFMGRRLGS